MYYVLCDKSTHFHFFFFFFFFEVPRIWMNSWLVQRFMFLWFSITFFVWSKKWLSCDSNFQIISVINIQKELVIFCWYGFKCITLPVKNKSLIILYVLKQVEVINGDHLDSPRPNLGHCWKPCWFDADHYTLSDLKKRVTGSFATRFSFPKAKFGPLLKTSLIRCWLLNIIWFEKKVIGSFATRS